MADEIRNSASKLRVVRLLGHRDDAGAWQIRDFLKRSVVEFQWIELSTEEDCRHELGLSDLENVNLPVVELPDGTRLFGATLREVADRLGFVTKPKLRQYDVSIYGAGPAGLSAAVYAASEGLSTVLIERSAVGGQAGTTSMIENYMGFPQGINGADLAERARQQARHRSRPPPRRQGFSLLAPQARALLSGNCRPGFLRGRRCSAPLDQTRRHRGGRRGDGHRLHSPISGRDGIIPCTNNRVSGVARLRSIV